jgi:hypothetical protein
VVGGKVQLVHPKARNVHEGDSFAFIVIDSVAVPDAAEQHVGVLLYGPVPNVVAQSRLFGAK